MKRFYTLMRKSNYRRGPRLLGGVLGGFAALTSLDVTWVRIGFLIFCLLPGPAFVLYLLLWVTVPDRSDSIVLERLIPGRRV